MSGRRLRPDVSIVTSGHDVADARLHRIAAALVRRGLIVEVLGLGSDADGPVGVECYTWPRAGLAARLRRASVMAWRSNGAVVMALDPDSLVAAYVVGRLRQQPVVADIHEDYAALIADRSWARGPLKVGARALAAAASWLARRTALTVVADDHVPPVVARSRLVVRNEPDLRLIGPAQARDLAPRAVYVGDVRRSRGLPMMLAACSRLPDWTLDVVGPVAREDQSWLAERLTADPDLNARVRWHGRLPPTAAWQVAHGAWVGLCLLDATDAFIEAVPSKVYEYLSAGIAPIVTDLPRSKKVVRLSGNGRVVTTVDDVVTVLTEYTVDPGRLAAECSQGTAWVATNLPGDIYDLLAQKIEELGPHD